MRGTRDSYDRASQWVTCWCCSWSLKNCQPRPIKKYFLYGLTRDGKKIMEKMMSENDLLELQQAYSLLNNSSLADRIVNKLGIPIEKGMAKLPANWQKKVGLVTEKALSKAADVALFSLDDAPHRQSSNFWHKAAVAVSGGVGGFFGLSTLPIELPTSTTIMLRSIADIARSQGESLSLPDTKVACLEVFAFGNTNKSKEDNKDESGYYGIRLALGSEIAGAIKSLGNDAGRMSSSSIITLIQKVAERFGVAVTEQAVAELLPFVGAMGGAAVNLIFIDHFQNIATGHFIIRKLERKYGENVVHDEYLKFKSSSL